MHSAKDKPWDYIWSPLDVVGETNGRSLSEPLSIRMGGHCLDCGSNHLAGLKILVCNDGGIDLFSEEVNYIEQVRVVGVMACAHWHRFLVPTDFPEELRSWLFELHNKLEETGCSSGDVRDHLSDRWFRWTPDLMDFPSAGLAFGEAIDKRLGDLPIWPPSNIDFYIPGEEGDGRLPGYRLWVPKWTPATS